MTEQAQQIAIAEACGWTCKRSGWGSYLVWTNPKTRLQSRELPNYLHDLNAMHEAEKVLTFEQCQEFNELLKGCRGMVPKAASLFQWHAAAAQRAEAFLRALGLWKEGE